jgi:hypothetical protein
MTHPCADHLATCDHCPICEAGVCCAGLSAQQRTQLIALIQAELRSQRFHRAVTAEASRTFTLAELVQIETERQVLGAPLHSAAVPVLSAAAESAPAPATARKEAVRVLVSRLA